MTPRLTDILDAAAAFYREVFWEWPSTDAVRSSLLDRGLAPELLHRFGVGYSPFGWTGLIDRLAELGYSASDLEAAGLAVRSHRSKQLYDRFRSRLMFPVSDGPGAGTIGFMAFATHGGPSWPKWLISPDTDHFQGTSAIFGLDHAAAAIERGGAALVLGDCLEVLCRHQNGQEEAVAVIRSQITPDHVAKLNRYAPKIVASGPRVLA